MGVEEEPLPRLNVTDDFAREYVQHGGSPSTVGDVDPDATTPSTSRRTYYRGPAAVVTDELFMLRDRQRRLMSISGLSNLRTVSTEEFNRIKVGSVAAGVLVASAALWLVVDSLRMIVGAAGLAVVTVILPLLFLLLRKAHRRWELHATYQGATIVLFSTNDEREFNQVRRALLRALESRRGFRSS